MRAMRASAYIRAIRNSDSVCTALSPDCTSRPLAHFQHRDLASFCSALGCRSGNRRGRDVITLKHRPTFEISESKDGGYLVLVTWPEGPEQQLGGFASVEAARA